MSHASCAPLWHSWSLHATAGCCRSLCRTHIGRLVPIVPDGGYLDANEADVLPFLAVHTARSRLKPCTTFVVPSARDVAVDDHIAITGYTGMSSLHLLPWNM